MMINITGIKPIQSYVPPSYTYIEQFNNSVTTKRIRYIDECPICRKRILDMNDHVDCFITLCHRVIKLEIKE